MSDETPCIWDAKSGDAKNNAPTCYRNDRRHGLWEFRFTDGTTQIGRLITGNPCGKWKWQLMLDGKPYNLHSHYIQGEYWEFGITMEEYKRDIFIGDEYNCHTEYVHTEVGKLLHRFKYENDATAGEKLLPLACAFLSRHKTIKNIDIIAPIPSSFGRTVTNRLAMGLSKCLGIQCSVGAITTSNTSEMKFISPELRAGILAGKFSASQKILAGKSVLLVDDFSGSGATLEESAKTVLRQGKAASVHVFAFNKTNR